MVDSDVEGRAQLENPVSPLPPGQAGQAPGEHSWGMQQAGYQQPDPSQNSSGEKRNKSSEKHRFSWCSS